MEKARLEYQAQMIEMQRKMNQAVHHATIEEEKKTEQQLIEFQREMEERMQAMREEHAKKEVEAREELEKLRAQLNEKPDSLRENRRSGTRMVTNCPMQ